MFRARVCLPLPLPFLPYIALGPAGDIIEHRTYYCVLENLLSSSSLIHANSLALPFGVSRYSYGPTPDPVTTRILALQVILSRGPPSPACYPPSPEIVQFRCTSTKTKPDSAGHVTVI